jgi:arylsulfatase A-like enzyme
MKRNILLITTDQQRFDSLGCTGSIARTPVIDGLAAEGLQYRRVYGQNLTCTPARCSILTGQYPLTHGAWALGVPLPEDSPTVARYLNEAGYRTALIGKAHFQPQADPHGRFSEGRMVRDDSTGPFLGFEYAQLAQHGPFGLHYGRWMERNHPEELPHFLDLTKRRAHPTRGMGGDTFAPDVQHNGAPRELYHTEWVADRTIDYLAGLGEDESWFVWLSFPDPHHPWNPPDEERKRYDWRDLELPDYYPGAPSKCVAILERKPAHWLGYWDGTWTSETSRGDWAPHQLRTDQLREITALVHIQNELIDEASGRVLAYLEEKGQLSRTDVIFTTDHGELQGEFGLLFKGPFHCNALLHLPLIWRPAPSSGCSPATINDVVQQIDIAPTLCRIAGLPVPAWMQGRPLPAEPLPRSDQPALTTYDSPTPGIGMHIRTVTTDRWRCTTYLPSTVGEPTGLERFDDVTWEPVAPSSVIFDGSEGELYDLDADPGELDNLWDDPGYRRQRDELLSLIHDSAPTKREPWPLVEAGI